MGAGADAAEGPVITVPMPAEDEGAPLSTAPIGSFAPLAIAEHMPASCRGRYYVNVASLVGSDMPAVKQIVDPLIAKEDRRGHIRKALKILSNGGLDPYQVIKEVVICERPEMAAVAFKATRSGDVLEVLRKAATAAGAPNAAVRSLGGVKALVIDGKGETAALVKPGVLLLAGRLKRLEPALEAKAGAAGFADASRYVVWYRHRDILVALTDRGSTLDMRFVVQGGKDAHEMMNEAQASVDEVASYLDRTPISVLASKARSVRFSVQGTKLIARGSLSRGDIRQVLKALRPMSADDLEDLAKGRYGRKRTPPPPPPALRGNP